MSRLTCPVFFSFQGKVPDTVRTRLSQSLVSSTATLICGSLKRWVGPFEISAGSGQCVNPSTVNEYISHRVLHRLCSLTCLWPTPSGTVSWKKTVKNKYTDEWVSRGNLDEMPPPTHTRSCQNAGTSPRFRSCSWLTVKTTTRLVRADGLDTTSINIHLW